MTSVLKVDNIQNSSGTSAIEINSSGVPLMKNIPHLSVGFNGATTAVSLGDNIFDTSETGTHIIDSRHDITIDNDGDITINTAGIYYVSLYSMALYRFVYLNVNINGSSKLRPYFDALADNTVSWITASAFGIFSLNANDVLTVTAGIAQSIHGDHHTRFTAHMIGGQ